jgi:two-component system response regulator RegA
VSPRRILLVDDDAAFRSVLGRRLVRLGHSVVEAEDAVAAREYARSFAPEWILLDLKLGRDNGLALVEPLLALAPEARIVIATGYASIPTAVDAIRRGATNYLAKPFDLQSLLRAFDGGVAHAPVALEHGPMALQQLAWEHIQRMVSDCNGNISEAARRLGVDRRTLQRRLAKRAARQRSAGPP